MAISAYSEANNYDLDVPMDSVDLVGKVMSAKQQRYDSNKAEIDAFLSQYQNIDLIRPEDRERLFGRLNNLSNMVNESGGVDYSDPNLKTSLQAHIGQALDPYTFDQIAETKKIRSFNEEIEARKKKKDGGYNSENHAYALKNAKVREYMNGEVDELEPLEYSEYFNIRKEAEDKTAKWAKEAGVKTMVEETTGEVYYETKTKKVLTTQEVSQYVSGLMASDPRYQKQLEIDSWSKFKGYSDEQFGQMYKTGLNNQLPTLEESLTYNETLLKTIPEGHPERALGESIVEANRNKISRIKELRDSDRIDRKQVEMQITAEQVVSDISRAYTKDDVTKVTKTDLPSRVASRELSDQIKVLKLQEARTKALTGNDLDVGVMTEPIQVDEQDTRSSYELNEEKVSIGIEAFEAELRKDPSTANLSRSQIEDTMLALGEKGANQRFIGTKPASSEAMRIATDTYSALVLKKDTDNKIYDNYNALNRDFYEDMLDKKENIRLNNLSLTMPTVAKKLGEGASFDSLSEKDRVAVLHELASSSKEDLDSGVEKIGGKTPIEMYMDVFNSRHPDFKPTAGERASVVGGTLKSIYEAGTGLALALRGEARNLGYAITGETQKGRIANQRDRERAEQAWNKADELTRSASRAGDIFWRPDSSLAGIQSDQAGSEAGVNLMDRYKAKSNALAMETSAMLKDNVENVRENTVALLNPKLDKAQKIAFETMRPWAQQAETPVVLAGDSTMKISYGGGEQVKVDVPFTFDAKGKVKSGGTFEMPYAQLPNNVKRLVRVNTDNWAYSPKNPKSRVNDTVLSYQVPKDADGVKAVIDGFSTRGNQVFSPENMKYAEANFIKDNAYYQGISNLSKEDTDKILAKTYKVFPNHSSGGISYAIYETVAGQEGRQGNQVQTAKMVPNMVNYDPELFEIFALEEIDRFIRDKLTVVK